MTEQIKKTENQIKLINEKIHISKSIINTINFYTSINNENLTSDMLKDIKKTCTNLLESDF